MANDDALTQRLLQVLHVALGGNGPERRSARVRAGALGADGMAARAEFLGDLIPCPDLVFGCFGEGPMRGPPSRN